MKSHNIPISTKVKIEYTVWSHEESTRLYNFTKIDYEQVEKECVGSYAIKKTGNDSLDIIEASLTMPPIAPQNMNDNLFHLIFHEGKYFAAHPGNKLKEPVTLNCSIDQSCWLTINKMPKS